MKTRLELAMELTAEQLKSHPTPHLLMFGRRPTEVDIKTIFRQMMSKWHPDKKGGDSEVAAIIVKARDSAASPVDNVIEFEDVSRKWVVRYYVKSEISGVGIRYQAGCTTVLVTPGVDENRVKALSDLATSPRQLQADHPELFVTPKYLKTLSGENVLYFAYQPGFVNLRDLVAKVQAPLPLEHCAWIMSRLVLSLWAQEFTTTFCLLASAEDLVINPTTHRVGLWNGWQYVTDATGALKTVPTQYLARFPEIRKSKAVTYGQLLSQYRTVVLALMGPEYASVLDSPLPPSLKQWFLTPFSNMAEAQKAWDAAKDKDLPKQFVKWGISFTDIYPDAI